MATAADAVGIAAAAARLSSEATEMMMAEYLTGVLALLLSGCCLGVG
jgi:hypothetical protein